MKYFDWDIEKNKKLKKERGVSFEEAVLAMKGGDLLYAGKNPNQSKYPNQSLFIVKMREYCFLVPFVRDDEKCFLKTIIPSRKATKKYLSK
ncbi:MAG: BrnT family toxin [bacterium]|nr:BrnT family toxin [bacterium]